MVKHKKTAPVLLLIGLLLCAVFVIELFLTFVINPSVPTTKVTSQIRSDESPITKPKGDLFETLYTKYPGYDRIEDKIQFKNITIFTHNPVLGSYNSRLKIVVFSDPNCSKCRAEVQKVLTEFSSFKKITSVTYKFLPIDIKEQQGGIFNHMAWYAGVFTEYNNQINIQNNKLEPENYVEMLEKAGVDLNMQRLIMAKELPKIIKDLQEDISLAKELEIKKPPVIFLNGYRLGENYGLPYTNIKFYVRNLLEGNHILGIDESSNKQK